MVPTEHGAPAEGGLLDVFWPERRECAFDQLCLR
jgi:hypothetical protein